MPPASTLLDVWENGEREHPIDRALSILAAFSGESRAQLAALGIHRRDALLVRSRILAFGPLLEGATECPACGSELELALQLSPPPEMEDGGAVDVAGERVLFRPPNSYDLAAVVASRDVHEAQRVLRARCIQSEARLDDTAIEAAEQALEALCDPATIDVSTTCPACEAPFVPVVDIAIFLWFEIATYALRLLDDVHALASRYGWSERDVLALPDARRRRYLEALA